jgi:hypothetical protein
MELKRWSMPSANGRTRIDCSESLDGRRVATCICSFEIEGLSWQRDRALEVANLVRDFTVQLPQVVIDLEALKELRERLIEWQVNPSDFICSLNVGTVRDQTLTVSIGRNPDLIYDVGKPACTLVYHCGASMSGKWAFVVDQSCIRLCADSITEFLRNAEY